MALVPAKCTQCGGNIQVDNQKEAAICPYCGTAYIVEQAINNYKIVNNIRTDAVTIVNQSDTDNSADGLYKMCLDCCNKGMYGAMDYKFKKFEQEYPTDYRVYYIKLLEITESFSKVCFFNGSELHILNSDLEWTSEQKKRIKSLFDTILRLAPSGDANIKKIKSQYDNYVQKLSKEIEKEQNEIRQEEERLREEKRQMQKQRQMEEIKHAVKIISMILFTIFVNWIGFTQEGLIGFALLYDFILYVVWKYKYD